MPHFIIAGAQRSGTTFLHTLLEAHPEIEMAHPMWPEPKFFLREPWRDEDARTDYERAHFGRRPGALFQGEKSTSYIEFESVAARIARVLPEARIVFLLRNPVRRAISNYHFTKRHGLENRPMEEALCRPELQEREFDRSRISVSPFRYLDRGRYADYLAAYARHLPKSQIKPLVFERLTASPEEYRELLEWLGADPEPADVWSRTLPQRQTEGAEPVAAGVLEFLSDHFSVDNERLAREWGLDLSTWEKRRAPG